MNPLKNLFNKVFEPTPPARETDEARQDAAFEWNPEEESVAPTSATATSWKRRDEAEEAAPVEGESNHSGIAEAAHSLPAPVFGKPAPEEPKALAPTEAAAAPEALRRPLWNEPVAAAPRAPETPFVSVKPAGAERPAASDSSAQAWVKPSVPDQPVAVAPLAAQSLIPLSDFEDVYGKAGIKSPVHGYGVERVYRLLTSRRLAGLDRSVRRSALLTALDAAGVPASDVSQDAVLRRKALTAFEAEKALELQSLRSRNESRAEALQDTVETFTRQKQSQIERLAQGSTAAVRAQSDLEIRKRMEQDRLYRSLAYFVEPLPPVTEAPGPSFSEGPKPAERLEARIERSPAKEAMEAETTPAASEASPPPGGGAPAEQANPAATEEESTETRPVPESGLEMALRAAAEEARQAARGRVTVLADGSDDPVESLRRLREPPKTETES